ncbi:MAG: hypothetical protein AAB229_06085 [Candidatus Hydrogenedentota bacterium]
MRKNLVAILAGVSIILAAAAYFTTDSAESSASALLLRRPPQIRPRIDASAEVRGMALGLHAGSDNYDYEPALAEIRELGANSVELVIAWYQADVRSSEPRSVKGRTPSLRRIARTIETARGMGLRVHLLPIVLLESAGDREWRGVMEPEDPDAWWRNYESLLKDLARVADEKGAESLSVGSELLWSERERARWQKVIAGVRSEYRGKLIYSANWDHYDVVEFWDLLDQVGISGYFELTHDSEATRTDLELSWMKVRQDLLDWLPESKPLLFTEIGCPAVDGGAVYPWNYTMQTTRDDEEQARALAAFFEAWKKTPGFSGAFVYEWDLPGTEATNYSPKGREGEEVVKRWLRGHSPTLQHSE